MNKRIQLYLLMPIMCLLFLIAVPAGVKAPPIGDTCIVPGCTVSVADGGFTDYTMIGDEKYYHISNAEQLAHINDHLDLNYIQTADIDLSQYDGGLWTPIGGFYGLSNGTPDPFTGKYLGNGYQIKNLQVDFNDPSQNSAYAGLFGYVGGTDAKISGVTVTVAGAEITAYNYAIFGGITGDLYAGNIEDCHVIYEGDVVTGSTPNGDLGGITGRAYPKWNSSTASYDPAAIDGCTVTLAGGSLRGASWANWAGGIVGWSDMSITNCDVVIAAGEMIEAPMAGGITGYMNSKMSENGVSGCTVTGEGSIVLSPQHYYDGYAGGIAGCVMESAVTGSSNSVKVDASGISKISAGCQVYAGGIAGYAGSRTNLNGCSNTGEVSVVIANKIVDYYDVPTVSDGNEYAFAGGIAGYVNGYSNAVAIENCENNADISSVNLIPGLRAYAGGLIGHVDSNDGDYAGVNVFNCANLGADKEVYAEAGTTMAGGLFGSTSFHDFTDPNIFLANSYNRASVTGLSNSPPTNSGRCVGITAGGIIGAAGEISVANTYSTAADVSAVTNNNGADGYEGGLFGVVYMTAATQNYYEINSTVLKAVGGLVQGQGMDIVAGNDINGAYQGATAAQLKTEAFYGDDWVWYAGGGTAPDYYSTMDPWRMIAADSYPVLKGLPYTPCPAKQFKDVDITKWYHDAVDFVLTEGLFKGLSDTVFAPNDTMTRAMLVTVLYRLEGEPAVTENPPFHDVAAQQWYSDAVAWAAQHDIVKGYTAVTFGAKDAATREQTATILYRYAQYKGYDLSAGDSYDLLTFSDGAKVSGYAVTAMKWACGEGILQGDNNKLSPTENSTRAQVAAMLMRFVKSNTF